MPPLLPCEHCRRHVFSNESTCRFCGSALARPITVGVVAVATALLAGCASKYGGPPPPTGESPREPTTTTAPTPAPTPTPAPSASEKVVPEDDGSSRDLYGGPPPPEGDR